MTEIGLRFHFSLSTSSKTHQPNLHLSPLTNTSGLQWPTITVQPSPSTTSLQICFFNLKFQFSLLYICLGDNKYFFHIIFKNITKHLKIFFVKSTQFQATSYLFFYFFKMKRQASIFLFKNEKGKDSDVNNSKGQAQNTTKTQEKHILVSKYNYLINVGLGQHRVIDPGLWRPRMSNQTHHPSSSLTQKIKKKKI